MPESLGSPRICVACQLVSGERLFKPRTYLDILYYVTQVRVMVMDDTHIVGTYFYALTHQIRY